jgi:two-component system, sensor histidine kinase RpfC
MIVALRRFARSVATRFGNRTDSEHEQAIVRLALVSVIVAYVTITDWAGHESTRDPVLYILFGLSLAIAIGVLVEIYRRPEVCPRRRIIAMVADNVAIATCMYFTTDLGAPLFGVFLFVTFGYGFRYGRAYLFGSQALSIAGFAAVLSLNPFWHGQLSLGLGLMFSMVILPLYVSTLLTRIQKARAAAEAANLEKTRFLSTMSHEMRTPLNGVIGINELLYATPLNAEQRELLTSSQSSAQLMLSLVNNVLDISKIEAGRLDLEHIEFDLHKLLHTSIRPLRLQAERKRLALNLNIAADLPYQLVGSPIHVRQILLNLVTNALKFTESGSVSVRVARVADAAGRVRFEVEDTGIGIAAEALPRIFERFYQADQSITRVYGGSGLGTAISKQLVDLMGGEIGVQSEAGRGSLFWFELPFEVAAPRSEAATLPNLPGLRVNLLVTEPSEVASLTASLTGWGTSVDVSAGAPELLRALGAGARQNRPFHLLLVDARALKMDPVQLAATVRSEHAHHPPMLILLNPELTGRGEEQLQHAGYASLLSSPVDKSRLFNVVHSAVAKEELPLVATDTVVPITAAGARPKRTAARSVLVAEDNATNRLVIQKVLEGAGHDVTLVDNGEEVLDALETRRFDCVIVDWHMPVMGGLEALKLYRMMEPQGERLPFVMFTANATKEAMNECNAAGFDAFLTKPIEPRKLLDTVHRLAPEQCVAQRRQMLVPEPPTTTTELSAELIDVEKLKELEAIGRSGFVADLIAGFNADGEKLVVAMGESTREADYKGFREHVHALKGSAGSLGAEELYKKCREVSQIAPRELPARAEKLQQEIEGTFGATREALAEYVAKHLRATG